MNYELERIKEKELVAQMRHYQAYDWRDWEKPRKISVRVVDVPADIRTDLPNTSLESWRYDTNRLVHDYVAIMLNLEGAQ
jgi:hypothetical protein